jgi:glycyl-tRNA synthetase
MASQEDVFKKLIAHCKEYGFVFPSSEIYDGLGAVYDYGQNGVELKNNIKKYWWDSMVLLNENVVGIDAAIFMHPTTWKASGHVYACKCIDRHEHRSDSDHLPLLFRWPADPVRTG